MYVKYFYWNVIIITIAYKNILENILGGTHGIAQQLQLVLCSGIILGNVVSGIAYAVLETDPGWPRAK